MSQKLCICCSALACYEFSDFEGGSRSMACEDHMGEVARSYRPSGLSPEENAHHDRWLRLLLAGEDWKAARPAAGWEYKARRVSLAAPDPGRKLDGRRLQVGCTGCDFIGDLGAHHSCDIPWRGAFSDDPPSWVGLTGGQRRVESPWIKGQDQGQWLLGALKAEALDRAQSADDDSDLIDEDPPDLEAGQTYFEMAANNLELRGRNAALYLENEKLKRDVEAHREAARRSVWEMAMSPESAVAKAPGIKRGIRISCDGDYID